MKYGKILEQHISNYVARPNLAMDPEDVYNYDLSVTAIHADRDIYSLKHPHG